MKTLVGNLIELAEQGEFEVIIHGCNCFCTMGAGIAKQIKIRFPEAYQADLKTLKGDKSKLGKISWAEVQTPNGKLIIANAYTQFDWRGKGNKADYDAIRQAFRKVKEQFLGKLIGYPAIGAGLAGGDWNIISKIIDAELQGENHTFVKFNQ
ncbi:MAG: O-acetyl-ADP-ribose deacetylase (regulator of RNase III) [Arenicella sp.]|jgi:O-acetyl-ADP-ribose deacetylase (regulator of RNase III)